MKYSNIDIYVTEIPDEICLGISILGCPIHCDGCHSTHVWDINCKGMGKELTTEILHKAIENNFGISCILFFGGEWCSLELKKLLKSIDSTKYKRALYTGRNLRYMLYKHSSLLNNLEYLKVGEYNKELGGLNNSNTNQRLYEIYNETCSYSKKLKNMKDITYKFWRKSL